MKHKHIWSRMGALSGRFKWYKCLADGCGQMQEETWN